MFRALLLDKDKIELDNAISDKLGFTKMDSYIMKRSLEKLFMFNATSNYNVNIHRVVKT